MYSLRDDSDNDACADYRTQTTRYTGARSVQQSARVSPHRDDLHSSTTTTTEEGQEHQTPNTQTFSTFYNSLIETSTHVDVHDLCDTPPAWEKLPECPLCATGRRLDVLHIARSCLCSPYPCEGHTCACSERNVTPARLSTLLTNHCTMWSHLSLDAFFCLRSSSNSPSWLISVLQLLCCKHAVVAHSRTSSTFQQVPCQVSVLQRVILPGRHRASRSSRLIAHSTTNHVTIQCTNKHPPLSFDGIHNEEQTQHLFFFCFCVVFVSQTRFFAFPLFLLSLLFRE